jgi:hypothetical protein
MKDFAPAGVCLSKAQNMINIRTRIVCVVTTGLIMISASPIFGQPETQKPQPTHSESQTLTKFDLDFPGGTPRELVAAMQKAMGRPLNVIVSPQASEVRTPPLTMRSVTAAQLFKALTVASPTDLVLHYYNNVPSQRFRMTYSFKTEGNITDDSIWYFNAELPPPDGTPSRSVRFYLLTPFLDRGLTVDDITTAIQTGWKMAGISGQLSYHKETKLLIVVGDETQFNTVDGALFVLKEQMPKPATGSEAEKAAEPKKTEK